MAISMGPVLVNMLESLNTSIAVVPHLSTVESRIILRIGLRSVIRNQACSFLLYAAIASLRSDGGCRILSAPDCPQTMRYTRNNGAVLREEFELTAGAVSDPVWPLS